MQGCRQHSSHCRDWVGKTSSKRLCCHRERIPALRYRTVVHFAPTMPRNGLQTKLPAPSLFTGLSKQLALVKGRQQGCGAVEQRI